MREARDLVGLFFIGHAFFEVLELQGAAHFRQNRESERIPRREQLILRHEIAVFDQDVRAVNYLVASHLATTLVDDRQRAVAIHGDALALAALHRLQLDVLNTPFDASFVLRRFFEARRAADVESTHRELSAGLADRLSSDDADRFANVDGTTGGEIAAVTLDTASAPGFAG